MEIEKSAETKNELTDIRKLKERGKCNINITLHVKSSIGQDKSPLFFIDTAPPLPYKNKNINDSRRRINL